MYLFVFISFFLIDISSPFYKCKGMTFFSISYMNSPI